MRRFFHFSIRDLLWLTLVVAVAIGWFARERKFQDAVDQANARTLRWQGATGALERLLSNQGWTLEWDLASSQVTMKYGSETVQTFPTNVYRPSISD